MGDYISAQKMVDVFGVTEMAQVTDDTGLVTGDLLQRALDGLLSSRLKDSFVFADTDTFNTRSPGMPAWDVQHISGPNASDGYLFADINTRGLPIVNGGTITIDDEVMVVKQVYDKLLTTMNSSVLYAYLQYPYWPQAGDFIQIFSTVEGPEFVTTLTDRAAFVASGDIGILKRGAVTGYPAVAHTSGAGSQVSLRNPTTLVPYGPFFVARKQSGTAGPAHRTGAFIVQSGEPSGASQSAAQASIDLLSSVVSQAEALVNSYLRQRYTTPIAPVPQTIINAALDLARWYVYDDQIPEAIQKRYDTAVAWLKDLARGTAALDVETTSSTVELITASLTADDRRFTPDLLAPYSRSVLDQPEGSDESDTLRF